MISGDRLECVEEGTQTRVVELEAELRGEREASNRLREQLQVRERWRREEGGTDGFYGRCCLCCYDSLSRG